MVNKQEIEKAIEILMDIQSDWEDGEEYEAFNLALSALEQQLNGGWIPVSERLPEENGHYLVTYHEWSKGEYLPKFDFTCMKILRFYRGEFRMPICCDNKLEEDIHREVLAWQTLPEIWRVENEER